MPRGLGNNIFPKSMQRPGRGKVETTTLKGFSGGWNAIDDDISMAVRYVKTLINCYRGPSGGQFVRFGTDWFQDIKYVRDEDILDMEYFNGRIVAVTVGGHILTITDGGVVTEIWNTAIAGALPGSPASWGTTVTQVSFVPFKSELIVHDGTDKPITISSAFHVTYLQDAGTGSNVNVPIGKYGCIAANYHCIAGIPGSPTEVIISAAGTSGTFPGDPLPNDAISIDVGAYAPEGAASIRGIAGFRTNLIVFLQGISIQIKLGVYNDAGTHVPEFPDTFPKFGLIGDRCITKIENDLIFVGLGGLSSASRNVYSNALESTYISNIIEPEYRRIVGALTDTEQLLESFTVYDPLSRNLMIFTKDGEAIVYTSNAKLNYKGWSLFQDMDWTCGCTSFLGRVFFAQGTRIFQYGNSTFDEKIYADRTNDRDGNWANSTNFAANYIARDTVTEESYKCLVTHTSPATGTFEAERIAAPSLWELYEGEAISFEIELPWVAGRDAMKTKLLRYISIITQGTAEFTTEAYVDNLYKDIDDDVIYDPVASMVFIGNDAAGYGLDAGPYGGGRRSRDPRLTKFPAKFKSIKFRMFGSIRKPLSFLGLSFLFSRGNYFR